MQPHVIRLAGPWRYGIGRGAAEPTEPLATARWELLAALVERQREPGSLVLRRRFQRPGNLEPQERVWLVIERMPAAGSVLINARPQPNAAGSGQDLALDITHQLAGTNELEIRIEWPLAAGSPSGQQSPQDSARLPRSVRLEICGADG